MTRIAAYRYDAQGRRIEYVDHTREITTRYYYDGSNVVAEYGYTSGGGETLARTYVNGSQYLDERATHLRLNPEARTPSPKSRNLHTPMPRTEPT